MNEKNIVINQVKNIASNFYKYENLINKANNKNCKENKIGNIIKFSLNDYYKVFTELRTTNNYHVLLNDDSLICFYYEFNNNNEIIKHCLYYIPSPTENIVSYYQNNPLLTGTEIDNSIAIEAIELLEKYIRIDYSLEGKKEYIHTNVHMHYGLNSKNIRFPLFSKVYPEEFLYFILKYVYESDDERIENLELNNVKNVELSAEELKRFYINNVLDSETNI